MQVGPGQVRHRAVPAGAVDADREAVGGRHDRARLHEMEGFRSFATAGFIPVRFVFIHFDQFYSLLLHYFPRRVTEDRRFGGASMMD